MLAVCHVDGSFLSHFGTQERSTVVATGNKKFLGHKTGFQPNTLPLPIPCLWFQSEWPGIAYNIISSKILRNIIVTVRMRFVHKEKRVVRIPVESVSFLTINFSDSQVSLLRAK